MQYVRGLCWVLKYYYQGCASWNWYFPYHYAPFASDFVNIAGLSTQFEKGSKPFNPLEQLMGVFPAASSSHVPEPWAKLMHDPHSDIIDFYPEDFKIDLNGKKFAWQGVALLPFVDENRLFKALEPYYGMLTEQEVKRNKRGDCRLYISRGNKAFKLFASHYKNKTFTTTPEIPIEMDGMRGVILMCEENVPLKGTLPSPIMGLYDITENSVISVRFRDPEYDVDFIFPAVRLANAIDPPSILKPESGGDSNYRPRIGFNHNLPQAYVTQGGHRLLNNSMGGNRYQQQQHQQQRNNYQQQGYNYNYNSNNNRGGGGGARGYFGGNRGGAGAGYNGGNPRSHYHQQEHHQSSSSSSSSHQQNRYQNYYQNNRYNNNYNKNNSRRY